MVGNFAPSPSVGAGDSPDRREVAADVRRESAAVSGATRELGGREWAVVLTVAVSGLLLAAVLVLTPWSVGAFTGRSATAGSVEDVVVGVHGPADERVVPATGGAPADCPDVPET